MISGVCYGGDTPEFQLLVDQSTWEMTVGRPDHALLYLNAAVAADKHNRQVRLMRAKALAKMGDYEGALTDVDIVLQKWNGDPEALAVKGDTLYFMANFEEALINYHRALGKGLVLKGAKKEQICTGINSSEMAIMNMLEYGRGNVFDNLDNVLENLAKNPRENSPNEMDGDDRMTAFERN